MAPVSNTITSTTSATQDLEVFKNYPTEKNNNLLQQKYGSQDEFLKQIQAEGYAEGFKGQELNLPATEMLDEAAINKFLYPSGINNIDDTHVMSKEHSDEIMNQSTLKSIVPAVTTGGGQQRAIDKTMLIRLDDGLTYYPHEMSERGYSDSQITKGLRQGFLTDNPENMEVFNNFMNNQGISSVETSKQIPQNKFDWEERSIGIPTKKTEKKPKTFLGYELKEHEPYKRKIDPIKPFVDYSNTIERDRERLAAVGMDSDILIPLMEKDSGGYMSQWGLPIVNPDGKMWFYDSDKKAKIPFTDQNILADRRVKELLKREEVMKQAELSNPGDQNAAEVALDDYILKQEKNKFNKKNYVDDEGLHLTLNVGQEAKTGEPGSGRATDTGGLLEVQRRKMDQLMKKSETGLNKEDKKDLTDTLKGQGVDTTGMNDKALLAATIGFGIMASKRSDMLGAIGEGGLAGLKLAADIKDKQGGKSSDIQMITVKNDEGENVIVRYNKKKGTYEETGLKSGASTSNSTLQKIQTLSKIANVPEDVVATFILNSLTESKGKPREDQITTMMSILSRTISGMTEDPEKLRNIAEKIVDENMKSGSNFKESDIGL
mgnify:CR=1 FL=1|tara:strand:+ start:2819 stop:4627 length:1809 start_codon:yes stop_codon:yes gene_type:complete